MMKMSKPVKSRKRGFTLIELIVVIAILGILAAILVPSMLGIIGDSKEKVGTANARSVYSAAQAAYVAISAEGNVTPTNANVEEKAIEFLDKAEFGADNVEVTLAMDGEGAGAVPAGVESVKYITDDGTEYPYPVPVTP